MGDSSSTGWLESISLHHGGRRWGEDALAGDLTLTARRVVLSGRVSERRIRQVQVDQVVEGGVVFAELVDVRGGTFEVPLSLFRGTNEIYCSPFDVPSCGVRVCVSHRTLWRELLELVVYAVVFAMLIKTFLVQAFVIPSSSMFPTLKKGDRILVGKVEYVFRKPRRGDVVVFEYPRNPRRFFIKRIIGLPGERLSIEDGGVSVNGRPLAEPYKVEDERRGRVPMTMEPPRLGRDEYFVLGDNRSHSLDSRAWGTVPGWKIVGRALCIFHPLERAGFIGGGG